jgi:hypothetical protein
MHEYFDFVAILDQSLILKMRWQMGKSSFPRLGLATNEWSLQPTKLPASPPEQSLINAGCIRPSWIILMLLTFPVLILAWSVSAILATIWWAFRWLLGLDRVHTLD